MLPPPCNVSRTPLLVPGVALVNLPILRTTAWAYTVSELMSPVFIPRSVGLRSSSFFGHAAHGVVGSQNVADAFKMHVLPPPGIIRPRSHTGASDVVPGPLTSDGGFLLRYVRWCSWHHLV